MDNIIILHRIRSKHEELHWLVMASRCRHVFIDSDDSIEDSRMKQPKLWTVQWNNGVWVKYISMNDS